MNLGSLAADRDEFFDVHWSNKPVLEEHLYILLKLKYIYYLSNSEKNCEKNSENSKILNSAGKVSILNFHLDRPK